jgi:predicted MFS family arabinose efflux permease
VSSTIRQISDRSAAATGGGRPWLRVAAAMFCCGWGGNQFTPLLLMYRQLVGYSAVTVDAFLGAYVIGLVPGLLIAGSASDRYGRKPLLVAGTAASLVASVVLSAGATGELPIYIGRFLTGIAVGIAMAVGTSWLKELSQPPHDLGAEPGSGARRASLSLTAGFGLGAGVAGAIAQWGPWPMASPYIVHILVAAPALLALTGAPETRERTGAVPSLWADLKVPAAGHRRFLRVVVPMAPWIFGSAGIAYAVMPQLVGERLGHWSLAYATLLTVVTLGAGVLVQPLAKRLDSISTARATIVAMVAMACGMGVGAWAAAAHSPWLALGCAVLLGAAYGVAIVSGLLEIQRMVTPDDLAGLTGVYYALSYTGFLLPALLAALSALISYPAMLVVLTLLATASLVAVTTGSRTPHPSLTVVRSAGCQGSGEGSATPPVREDA